jgi:hypothetical protein
MPELESLVNYGGRKKGDRYSASASLATALVRLGQAKYLTKVVTQSPVQKVMTPIAPPPPPPAPVAIPVPTITGPEVPFEPEAIKGPETPIVPVVEAPKPQPQPKKAKKEDSK